MRPGYTPEASFATRFASATSAVERWWSLRALGTLLPCELLL